MSDVLSLALKTDELNAKIGGGIPRGSVILVEGSDGAGKSIMAQRIAYGLLQNSCTASYLSTELDTIGFIKQMESVRYGIKQDMYDKRLLFIPLFPFIGNPKLDSDLIKIIFSEKKLFTYDVVIFDTLSFLFISDDLSLNRLFSIFKQIKKFTSMGKTFVFCVDPDHLNKKFLTVLRSIADVYFSLEIKSVLGNLVRILNVQRFRRADDDVTLAIPFKVQPRIGVALELASLS